MATGGYGSQYLDVEFRYKDCLYLTVKLLLELKACTQPNNGRCIDIESVLDNDFAGNCRPRSDCFLTQRDHQR